VQYAALTHWSWIPGAPRAPPREAPGAERRGQKAARQARSQEPGEALAPEGQSRSHERGNRPRTTGLDLFSSTPARAIPGRAMAATALRSPPRNSVRRSWRSRSSGSGYRWSCTHAIICPSNAAVASFAARRAEQPGPPEQPGPRRPKARAAAYRVLGYLLVHASPCLPPRATPGTGTSATPATALFPRLRCRQQHVRSLSNDRNRELSWSGGLIRKYVWADGPLTCSGNTRSSGQSLSPTCP
jgi:hypothetical protein